MAAISARTAFAGARLQQQARSSRARVNTQTVAGVKKLNSYDEGWNKGKSGMAAWAWARSGG